MRRVILVMPSKKSTNSHQNHTASHRHSEQHENKDDHSKHHAKKENTKPHHHDHNVSEKKAATTSHTKQSPEDAHKKPDHDKEAAKPIKATQKKDEKKQETKQQAKPEGKKAANSQTKNVKGNVKAECINLLSQDFCSQVEKAIKESPGKKGIYFAKRQLKYRNFILEFFKGHNPAKPSVLFQRLMTYVILTCKEIYPLRTMYTYINPDVDGYALGPSNFRERVKSSTKQDVTFLIKQNIDAKWAQGKYWPMKFKNGFVLFLLEDTEKQKKSEKENLQTDMKGIHLFGGITECNDGFHYLYFMAHSGLNKGIHLPPTNKGNDGIAAFPLDVKAFLPSATPFQDASSSMLICGCCGKPINIQ